jgi:hypothetical protein
MPRSIDGPEYDALRGTATAALRALGLRTGLTHMEWFRRPDGTFAVSEVAVRPPGASISSMLNFAHDMDIYTEWARLGVYDAFEPQPRRWAVATAYLRGQGSGRVRAVRGWDELPERVRSMVVEMSLPQPGQMSSNSYEGEGTVTVRDADTSVVANALHRLVTDIRVELEPA